MSFDLRTDALPLFAGFCLHEDYWLQAGKLGSTIKLLCPGTSVGKEMPISSPYSFGCVHAHQHHQAVPWEKQGEFSLSLVVTVWANAHENVYYINYC